MRGIQRPFMFNLDRLIDNSSDKLLGELDLQSN